MQYLVNALRDFGLEVDQPILDGAIQRCPCRGSAKENGWYVGMIHDDHVYCSFGDWRSGEKQKYTDNGVSTTEVAEVWKLLAAQAERERLILNAQAAERAERLISRLEPLTETHPYLEKKGVGVCGTVYVHRGNLIVPMYNYLMNLVGYQKISPVGDEKRYLYGTEKEGACFVIPGKDSTVCLCEGYATGASIHEATGLKVLIAFDSGNLFEVAKTVYESGKYPHVMICADNDHKNEKNAGLDVARKIHGEFGFPYVYPTNIEGTDFNDLHKEKGIDSVVSAIKKGKTVEIYEKKKGKGVKHLDLILNPPGILKDIAEYYNETAVKPQPLFGIATGIILGSIVMGRRYKTDLYNNYSSLYVIISTKSGTGKDHVKTTIRKILKASGLDWLERSGGYTSANTVIKSLERQPLQLSFWEEFGQRLKEAGSNPRSLYCGVFRQLLDIWSSCHSVSMGEEYSDGSIPSVTNPALTMVGMATVKQLFEAITESLIEQGFVNRILPFVSYVDRKATKLGWNSSPPPKPIIEWCQSIWPEQFSGDGNLTKEVTIEEMASPGPDNEVTIPFSTDAIKLLNKIEEDVVEQSNSLEKIGLDDIVTRNRELTMRVSLIVAVMDRHEIITEEHVYWSWKLVNALYDQYTQSIKRTAFGSEFEKAKKQALEDLRNRGQDGMRPCFMPKTSPWSKWDKKLRQDILAELQDSGLAELVEHKPSRGPTRQTWVAVETDNNI